MAELCSVFARCATGSFVRNEPELVPVEGVVVTALGGVNPLTDIVGTRKREAKGPHNNADVKARHEALAREQGRKPTATPT